jgi:hypothetical protein
MISDMSRYEAGDVTCIEWEEFKVWQESLVVYMEYISISSSLAVEIILVPISPLFESEERI